MCPCRKYLPWLRGFSTAFKRLKKCVWVMDQFAAMQFDFPPFQEILVYLFEWPNDGKRE